MTAVAHRVTPPLDDGNREFWTSGATGELRLPRCAACDRWIFPPSLHCPDCGGVVAYATRQRSRRGVHLHGEPPPIPSRRARCPT